MVAVTNGGARHCTGQGRSRRSREEYHRHTSPHRGLCTDVSGGGARSRTACHPRCDTSSRCDQHQPMMPGKLDECNDSSKLWTDMGAGVNTASPKESTLDICRHHRTLRTEPPDYRQEMPVTLVFSCWQWHWLHFRLFRLWHLQLSWPREAEKIGFDGGGTGTSSHTAFRNRLRSRIEHLNHLTPAQLKEISNAPIG